MAAQYVSTGLTRENIVLFQLADWLIYEPSQVRPYAEGKPLETVQVFNSKRTEAKGLSEDPQKLKLFCNLIPKFLTFQQAKVCKMSAMRRPQQAKPHYARASLLRMQIASC